MTLRPSRPGIAAGLLVTLFAAAPLRAETLSTASQPVTSLPTPRAEGFALIGTAMQRAIDIELQRSDARLTPSPPSQSTNVGVQVRKRGVGRVILGAASGAVAGFFAGGLIGAGLEPPCNCDDPGFRGLLIGAPLGAVAGGIVGGKWFFR